MRFFGDLRLLQLVPCLLLAACGSKGGSGSGAGEGNADPNTVVVNDTMVALGGERLSGPPEDKISKHTELWDKLKERREKWKEAHPDVPFPGVLTVELGPNVTCNAAIGLFQTAGFVGYPHLTIKQGTTTMEVPDALPKLSGLTPRDDKGQDVFLHLTPEGDVEIRTGQCGGTFDAVPPASLPAALKELCGDRGDCVREVHLRCETGTPFSKILPALAEVRKGSAKMEFGGIMPCKPEEGAGTDYRKGRAFQGDLKWDEIDRPWAFPPPGAKAPPMTLKEMEVKVTGGVFAEDVRAAMKPKMAVFKQCYSLGLERNPNLQGRVTVNLQIGKKGGVMSVSKGETTDLPHKDAVECIVETAATISLPGKGSTGTVAYTIAMSPR